jgi:hypothetical protein
MTDDPPDFRESQVLSAIRAFNEAASAPSSNGNGNGNGSLADARARFVLDEIAHLDSRVLAIGELHRNGLDEAIPLVLAWTFGPNGGLVHILTFSSKTEAVAALEAGS